MLLVNRGKLKAENIIAADHHNIVFCAEQRIGNAARRAQGLCLRHLHHRHRIRLRIQEACNLPRHIAERYINCISAALCQPSDQDIEHRRSAERQQRLGNHLRNRAHTRTLPS